MKSVGLTGGIACGKSTVAKLLRGRGVPVIDADQVSRLIVQPGQPALQQIARRFGADLLLEDGSLDRKGLAALVMGDDPDKVRNRKDLEAITHPRIFGYIGEWLQEQAQQGLPVAVVEAAIMVESGHHRLYDALLVVRCSPDVQIRRLTHRQGISQEEARRWIRSQMPVEEKAALADAVIDNDQGPEQLAASTEKAWNLLLLKLGV